MRENFAVGRGLEKAAPVLQIFPELDGIDKVAVVRKGEITGVVAEKERLHIVQPAASGSGIAHVADCHGTFQSRKIVFVKHLRHKPFAFHSLQDAVFVHGNNAAALLPPVLERMQAVIDQTGGIRNAVNPENAAFLMKEIR